MNENRFVGRPDEMVSPQCNHCRRWNMMKDTCEAFPDGVPMEIAMNRHDHRQPFTGDNGVLFESKDGVPVQEWWFARNMALASRISDSAEEQRRREP